MLERVVFAFVDEVLTLTYGKEVKVGKKANPASHFSFLNL
jgi:hypothetical protein